VPVSWGGCADALRVGKCRSSGTAIRGGGRGEEKRLDGAHPDGGWANKLEGSSRFLNRAPTKREAQALGRERAMKDRVEHIIQNKDGQIGQRNSYGHDPHNVPG
jgi:hypothetical protein